MTVRRSVSVSVWARGASVSRWWPWVRRMWSALVLSLIASLLFALPWQVVASATASIPEGARTSPPVQQMGSADGHDHTASTEETTAKQVGKVADLPVPGAEKRHKAPTVTVPTPKSLPAQTVRKAAVAAPAVVFSPPASASRSFARWQRA